MNAQSAEKSMDQFLLRAYFLGIECICIRIPY